MNELDIIEQISATNSKNQKLEILTKNKNNKQLLELLEACYNYERKFYIRKFEVKPLANIEVDQHKLFNHILGRLETRAVIGNEARDLVESFFLGCTERQAKWYARILRRDLKAGVSEKTAAKFAKFSVFEVQLAKDGKDCAKAEELLKQGMYLSPKFDGYRCLAVIEPGSVTLYSR